MWGFSSISITNWDSNYDRVPALCRHFHNLQSGEDTALY